MYEKISVAHARHKVAVEVGTLWRMLGITKQILQQFIFLYQVLSYHASASPQEAEKFAVSTNICVLSIVEWRGMYACCLLECASS